MFFTRFFPVLILSAAAVTMSDDEAGWGGLADVAGVESLQTPPPSNAARSSSWLVEEDENEAGWSSVAASAVGSIGTHSSAAASSKKTKRGRPPGIKGSHSFRRELKAQVEEDKKRAPNQKRPLSRAEVCSIARKAKKGRLSEKTLQVVESESCGRPPTDPSPEIGTDLERSVFNVALSASHAHVHEALQAAAGSEITGPSLCRVSSDFAPARFLETLFRSGEDTLLAPHTQDPESGDIRRVLSHFFKPYRGYCTVSRDSEAFKVSANTFSRTLIRTASALRTTSRKLFGNLFAQAKKLLSENHEGVLFLVNFRFDETPSRIKVKDLDSAFLPTDSQSGAGKSTQASQQLAKLLQTELSISMLFRETSSGGGQGQGSHLLLTGYVPTPLQVLDRQTAQNLKQALDASMNIPGLEETAAAFSSRAFLFCADEFSANGLTQFGMQATRPGWLRMSTLCDIHKGSTVQGRVFDLTGPAISAVINFALSMQAAGSVGKLQALLSDLLSARFELQVGDTNTPFLNPNAAAHNKAVLDLYLSVPDHFTLKTADAVSSKARLRYTQRQRQRSIIEYFCNGDFRDTSKIIHWAEPGQYSSFDEALQTFLKYMVPALIPCACPIFPRSRWFGADAALDFVGLLCSVHSLFLPLVEAWAGRDIAPQPAPATQSDDDGDDAGWDLAPRKPAPVLPDQANESAKQGDPEGDEAAGAGGSDGFAWHAYHMKLKTSVVDWLRLGARNVGPSSEGQIALMRQYMAPVLRLMTSLLYVSSKKWTKEQLRCEADGGQREFRVLKAFEAVETLSLLKECLRLLKCSPLVLPEADWKQDNNVLCFTMLSRLGCATHQLLLWRRRKYPYALPWPQLTTPNTDHEHSKEFVLVIVIVAAIVIPTLIVIADS